MGNRLYLNKAEDRIRYSQVDFPIEGRFKGDTMEG